MSHEHKVAIEKIVGLCERSRTPTKRIARILDIGLHALGMTANQRESHISEIFQDAFQVHRERFPASRALRDAEKPKYERRDMFKPTNENWCPSYSVEGTQLSLVKVSLILNSAIVPPSHRVLAKGADDLCMSKDFDNKGLAMNMYDKIAKLDFVDFSTLTDLDFVNEG